MKRAVSVVGCLAVLVAGLLLGHVALAKQDKPPAAGKGEPSNRQDDIYVRPRIGGLTATDPESSCTALPCVEWTCQGATCVAGRDDELRDDLSGDIVTFEVTGKKTGQLDAMTFTVSGTEVTLTRKGSRFDWNFSDPNKKTKSCKHNDPAKTCEKDGIPGWLMGNLAGVIRVRYQGQAAWVPLANDQVVHLKSMPKPKEGK